MYFMTSLYEAEFCGVRCEEQSNNRTWSRRICLVKAPCIFLVVKLKFSLRRRGGLQLIQLIW